MRKSTTLRAGLACASTTALGILAACSGGAGTGSDTSFEAEALEVMACDTSVQIELRTAPTQPPTSGLDGVEVVLKDTKTGDPIDGATISLVPWMPLMGHGADVVPHLDATSHGRYVFTNVNLYMPGEWQLRFEITVPGSKACSASPTFNVP